MGLSEDFALLRRILGLPDDLLLPDSPLLSHRAPQGMDKRLETAAVASIERWYADDMRLYARCREIRQDRGGVMTRMQPPRILLISVHFGPLPFWLPAFLLSCRCNPDIDWLVVTDAEPPPDCPPNVSFLRMPLDAFNELCSNRLGFRVSIRADYTYKICDLRPGFGVIFAAQTHGYDFYGHADLDVVWGSLCTFMTPELLHEHDILTSRVDRVSGHFCLFRNSEPITRLHESLPGFRALVQRDAHCCLDEEHLTRYLHDRLNPSPLARFLDALLRRPHGDLRVHWSRVLTTSGRDQQRVGPDGVPCLLWRGGRTYDTDGRELMYLHFHKIRHTMTRIDFGYGDRPSSFRIAREGFLAG